jgi:hypothetical protein
MNELQEVILDTLMAAESLSEDYWAPGPLPLLVRALKAAGLRDTDDTPRALGYPLPLCVALEGAAWTVKQTDDLRTLAITVFTEAPPRQTAPMLSAREHVEAAAWSAGQAATFYNPDSRQAQLAQALMDPSARRAAVDVPGWSADLEIAISSYNGARSEFVKPRLAVSALFFALHAWRRLHEGRTDVLQPACWAVRDTARLAGLTTGLPGAVTFCVDLARRLGL